MYIDFTTKNSTNLIFWKKSIYQLWKVSMKTIQITVKNMYEQ